eukprot:600689_1
MLVCSRGVALKGFAFRCIRLLLFMTHRFWKNALRSSSLSSYPQSLSPSALRLLCVLDVRWVLIADPMSLRRTPQSPIYQNEFHSNARVNVLPSVNITTSNTFTASAANKTTHFCVVIPIHPLTVVASLLHFHSLFDLLFPDSFLP